MGARYSNKGTVREQESGREREKEGKRKPYGPRCDVRPRKKHRKKRRGTTTPEFSFEPSREIQNCWGPVSKITRHARASSWEPIARKDTSISSCTRTRYGSACAFSKDLLALLHDTLTQFGDGKVTMRSLSSRLETYKLRRGVSTALLIRVHILLAALSVSFLKGRYSAARDSRSREDR